MLLLLRVLRLKPSRPSLPRALLLSLSLEMTSRVAAAGADDRERSMMCVHVTCACIAPHTQPFCFSSTLPPVWYASVGGLGLGSVRSVR